VALDPQEGVFLANRGVTLAAAGRLAEAVQVLSAAVSRRPGDAVTLRNLGQALAEMGDPASALIPLEHALALDPAPPEPWLALAHARRSLGDIDGAAEAARGAIDRAAEAPAVAAQAAFLLSALGHSPIPDRAPAAYVRDLFDGFAVRFDAALVDGLQYRAPELLAALLGELGVPREKRLAVLDLGCGTGLSGVPLAPFAARLEGLDLSPGMLAEAAKRGPLYDALHEADLLSWLPRQAGRFDLIVAADVLCYLGDLAAPLAGIRAALAPGGICAFSVEEAEADGPAFILGEAMRYRHAAEATRRLAEAQGFAVLAQRRAVPRQEKGRDVAGLLLVLRKPG
jgi:predicted TPR repeat methyltransferase